MIPPAPVAFDLFAGAGGATIALHDAGYDVLGFEVNRSAWTTHEINGYRTVRCNLDDWDWTGYACDLLWASPPCQPFSAAGSHEGEDDDRDGMPAFLRAVDALRPPVVMMENVRGLTYTKHRPYLDAALAELSALGYEIAWRLVNMADYGVPQTRERLIVVARRDSQPITWPTPTHNRDGSDGLAKWVSMADALGWGMTARPYPTLAPGTESGGGRDPAGVGGSGARAILDGALNTGRDWKPGGTRDDAQQIPFDEPAPTFSAKSAGQWHVGFGRRADRPSNKVGADGATDDGYRARDFRSDDDPSFVVTAKTRSWKRRKLNPGVTDTQPNRRLYDENEPAPTVAFGHDAAQWTWEDDDDEPADDGDQPLGLWAEDRPATTIAGDPRVWAPGHKENASDPPGKFQQRRGDQAIRITVAEAATLQGFPPGYKFAGSMTEQFRQVGNACPPPFVAVLVRALGLEVEG